MMLPTSSPPFSTIADELNKELRRLLLLRAVLRLATLMVFLMGLSWMAFALLGNGNVFFTIPQVHIKLLVGFCVFLVFYYVMMFSQTAVQRKEQRAMGRMLSALFPEAVYDARYKVNNRDVEQSRLFGTPSVGEPQIDIRSFGAFHLRKGQEKIVVADVGISSASAQDYSVWGMAKLFYNVYFSPLFGGRMESSVYPFRGMFGMCAFPFEVRQTVILLPDHLEQRWGYVAELVQGRRKKHGAYFLHLEDVDFENQFMVYADDELEARKLLTPATMRRLTALRQTFGADLMLSFVGRRLFFASPMPDGFLCPGRASLSDAKMVERIYNEVTFCTSLAQNIEKKT